MNANPYTTNFIGATGEYPINEYINKVDVNASNLTLLNSNILNLKIVDTSNILQDQITATSNLIQRDENRNTIIRISAQNPQYPLIGDPIEMRFQNVSNQYITKITQTGELFVYHPSAPIPAGYGPGWWSVENKIANVITDTQGLRFDVTNLQAATGATAITDATTATAATTAAGAGLTAAGTATGAAGTAIAGGDYGTVAVGAAAGAMVSVLGYLSYQAQVKSNLTSNGFTTQAAIVQSDINSANLLLAKNISNICKATGFINCNIQTPQSIPKITTSEITLNGQNINNIFVPQNGGSMYNSLAFQKSTSDNPIVGYFGGDGDRVIFQPSTTTSDYACSIGINNTTKKFWFSASSNYAYEYWFAGSNQLIISSNILSFDYGTISTNNLLINNQNVPSIAQTTILTATPNVSKKTGFLINVHNPVYTDGGALVYSYDIYLPSYTSQAIVEGSSDPYRIFKISVCYATSYFEYLSNGLPNCLSYEIFMSYKAYAGAGGIGKAYLNICALGTPENYYLDKVLPNNIYIMRSPFSYFNYISIISTKIADVRVIIEDLLN
jgi:hypothetical protein